MEKTAGAKNVYIYKREENNKKKVKNIFINSKAQYDAINILYKI